jgi:cellulose synthase/poly-beta-1,6-N-acetylglucosamine synthase-like glycosyltransferase
LADFQSLQRGAVLSANDPNQALGSPDEPINIALERSLILPRVSFIVPTLNEAKNLPRLLPRIPIWAHEVIIVDGRSTDDTAAVARRLREEVKVVMEPRRGKGAALQAGFRAATGDIMSNLRAIPDGWRVLKTILRERVHSPVSLISYGFP